MYIGIDVGTGSARACIIDSKGDILGLASENIGLWQPEQGFYVSLPNQCRKRRVRKAYCALGTINDGHLALYLQFRPQDPQSTQHRSITHQRHGL